MELFEHDKDLTHLNTFGVSAKAELYAEYNSLKHLIRICRTPAFLNNEVLHIGSGSNLLFINNFDGLVLKSAIKGIVLYEKDSENIYAIASAGEEWCDFVEWCIENNLQGVENLAGIPGQVGAAAVQNIGAYGVEAKDVIHSVECFDTISRETVTFKNNECAFGYRDSRFKHEWKGRYIVLRVSFKLNRLNIATNLNYGPLKDLEKRLGHKPTLRETADEIISIRNSKLPDPAVIGSAGSFFKNPVVSEYYFNEEVLRENPDVPSYPASEGKVKVPAGWLIEHSGLKNFNVGDAFVWPTQCLVLANKGNATGKEVAELAKIVSRKVREKYNIELHPEVNYIDTQIEVTVLGSGTSKGVPEAGCLCRVCKSDDTHDKRLRASVLVKTHGMNILIDPSPDFRQQALIHDIDNIDAVLVTHEHFDHIGGIEDLRPYCVFSDIPVYLRQDVDTNLRKRLEYCFKKHPYPGVPSFETHIIGSSDFYINGLKITPLDIFHSRLPIVGFRIGNFGYVTDCKTMPDETIEKLQGVDTLIINALRWREHFSHICVEEALKIIEKIKPRQTYLTHMSHEIGLHTELIQRLPENVAPAYDGLTFTV